MTSLPMPIRSIAPWFGGKRTLAPAIVAELGKHTQYFEPFCGSMAVLFAKEPSQKETVNDLHGDLVNLARVVADPLHSVQLYERLQATLFGDDLLATARRRLLGSEIPEWDREPGFVNTNMQERAFWYFIACWQGRNGTAGTARIDYQLAVRWTNNGGSPTVRWRHAIDSLPWWHQRLQNVVILRRDAFEIIDRFEDAPGTAIYADPPYAIETCANVTRHGKGSRYLHEFNHASSLLEADQHQVLAGFLRGYCKARIVVSYYDCPRIRELYAGWTFIDCGRQKNLTRPNKGPCKPNEAPEVLIINGPAYSETEGSHATDAV